MKYRHELPPVEILDAFAAECAVEITADGWRIVPPAVLTARYGSTDLDEVADLADALEIALAQVKEGTPA